MHLTKDINSRSQIAVIIFSFMIFGFLMGCGERGKKKEVYRVGILSGLDFFGATIDGFKEKMAELGYVEGKNIVYDVHKTNFDPAEEQRILEQFVADNVDLIFTFPTEVSLAAKAATQGTDIPVVFANSFIEGVDLVDSIVTPGGHITGVRYPSPDIAIKSLEILLEVAPETKRLWLPYLDGYPSVPSQLEVLRPAAASYGVTLLEFPVNSAEEIEAELEAISQLDDPGIDAIMHIAEPVVTWPDAIEVISEFVAEHKMAYFGQGDKCVFTLTVDPFEVGKMTAPLADKILKGTPAGTIFVVSANPVMTINYGVAQEFGLNVPEGLLARADKIIR
jgi:putative ABC transport system substrate-binding protein